MRYAASALLVFSSILASSPISRAQKASIPATDPDFSIVVLPDTQYYHGNYAYVLQDQVNWVVWHQCECAPRRLANPVAAGSIGNQRSEFAWNLLPANHRKSRLRLRGGSAAT